ncbi:MULTISPECIES: hypothetical protein [Photobacterium]|nr:hypothetical protein [Photobacterium halotolerans]
MALQIDQQFDAAPCVLNTVSAHAPTLLFSYYKLSRTALSEWCNE